MHLRLYDSTLPNVSQFQIAQTYADTETDPTKRNAPEQDAQIQVLHVLKTGEKQDTPYSDQITSSARYLQYIQDGKFPKIVLKPNIALYGVPISPVDRLQYYEIPRLVKELNVLQTGFARTSKNNCRILVGDQGSGQMFAIEYCAVLYKFCILCMRECNVEIFMNENDQELCHFMMATPPKTIIVVRIQRDDSAEFKKKWLRVIDAFVQSRPRHRSQYLHVICEQEFAARIHPELRHVMFPGKPKDIYDMLAVHIDPRVAQLQSVEVRQRNDAQMMAFCNQFGDYDEVIVALQDDIEYYLQTAQLREQNLEEYLASRRTFQEVLWQIQRGKANVEESYMTCHKFKYRSDSFRWRAKMHVVINAILMMRFGTECIVSPQIHRAIPFGINAHVAEQAVSTSLTDALPEDLDAKYYVDLHSSAKGESPGALMVTDRHNSKVINIFINVNQYGSDHEQQRKLFAVTTLLKEDGEARDEVIREQAELLRDQSAIIAACEKTAADCERTKLAVARQQKHLDLLEEQKAEFGRQKAEVTRQKAEVAQQVRDCRDEDGTSGIKSGEFYIQTYGDGNVGGPCSRQPTYRDGQHICAQKTCRQVVTLCFKSGKRKKQCFRCINSSKTKHRNCIDEAVKLLCFGITSKSNDTTRGTMSSYRVHSNSDCILVVV